MQFRLPGPAKSQQYGYKKEITPPYVKLILVIWCVINASITGIPELRASAQAPLIPQTSSSTLIRYSEKEHVQDTAPKHHITVVAIDAGRSIVTPTPRRSSSQIPGSKAKTGTTEVGAVASVQTRASSATTQSILEALNAYRQEHGKAALVWDDALGGFAQQRADYFASKGDMDGHAGFRDFINNQDGFNKLGFYQLGENSGYGHQIDGAVLIKAYADSPAHNDNMLSGNWTHVGIGTAGSASNFVFGGSKR